MKPFEFKGIRVYLLWEWRFPVGFQRMGTGWDLRIGPLFVTKQDSTIICTGL